MRTAAPPSTVAAGQEASAAGPTPDEPGPAEDLAQGALSSLARGGALALAGAVVAGAGGFLLTVVVTRGLGPIRAGVVFEATALFLIFNAVAMSGADTGLVRAGPRYPTLGRSRDLPGTFLVALLPVAAVSAVLSAVMYLWAPQLVRVFMHGSRSVDGVHLLRLIAPFLVAGALAQVTSVATRGLGSIRPFVLITNVGLPLGRVLLVGCALALGFGISGVAVAWSAPLLVALAAALYVLLRRLRRLVRRDAATSAPARRWRSLAGEFWSFSGPRGMSATFDVTLIWFDVLLVGALRSTREAAIYAAASRFITTGTLVMQATRIAIIPRLSALLAKEDRRGAHDVYTVSTQWTVLASWPLYLALATYGPVLLRVFGRSFPAGASALAIVAVATLVNLGVGNAQVVLLMAGKSTWQLANLAVALAANVLLNLVLVPRFGIVGAASAWAVSIAIDNIASFVEVRYLLGRWGFDRGIALAAGSAVLCFGVLGALLRLLTAPTLPYLVLYAGAATGCYLLLLFRLRRWLTIPSLHGGRIGRHRATAAHPGALT